MLRHVQPRAALLARLVHGRDSLATGGTQQLDRIGIHLVTGDQRGWGRHFQVVLCHESFQDVRGLGVLHVRRKIRPVAQMPPIAHHRQVDAGLATLNRHCQDIHIPVVHRLHRLLVQDLGQGTDLVAQFSRLLELQSFGMGHHALLERLHHLLGVAAQKAGGALHIARIVLWTDLPHTRGRAALDLVQQARSGAVVEHRVLAGAQTKDFLHEPNGFAHRPHAGVRTKILVRLVHGPTVVDHPWHLWRQFMARAGFAARGPGDLQVRIAFVVPKQDVVLGLERLDEVVFQQQGLSLGAHHGGLHARDLAHHVANARAPMVTVKIGRHPLFKLVGLAHVQHLIMRIKIAVYPGERRQGCHLGDQRGGETVGGFGRHRRCAALGFARV